MNRRTLLRALAAATALPVARITGAADYPGKSIRILVPFTPGGFNDQLARTLSHYFTERWQQSVIVDNRPGGATIIATDMAARARNDGYTLLIVSFAFAVNPSLPLKLPYDTLKAFAPVILAATTPNVLVVNPNVPVRTVKEFIALAKAKNGALNYASAGNGTSNHLCMELFRWLTGVQVTHIPYKGSAPAVSDLLGGKVDVMFDNAPNVLPHVKGGKLRALAITSAQRSAVAPGLPTIAESVPGFDVRVWFGVVAPAGTPQPVITKLNGEINRVLALPKVRASFQAQGVEVAGGTPQQFAAHLNSEVSRWAKLVKDAGVKLH